MGDLAQSVGSLVARVKQSERAAAAVESHCPKERPDEICNGSLHHSKAVTGRSSRQCPLLAYLKARGELSAALTKAGYGSRRDAKREPVHLALLSNLTQDYPGPAQALRHARDLGARGFGAGYNLLLHGDVGLGKTRIGMGLLFWALWDNKPACRVTSPDLLDVAIGQASFEREARDAAAQVIKHWQQQTLLLFDDLGTLDERDNNRIFAVLSSILDDFEGQTVTTTNLRGNSPGDFFGRVKDRLMATREIKGVRVQGVAVEFSGKSQRRV